MGSGHDATRRSAASAGALLLLRGGGGRDGREERRRRGGRRVHRRLLRRGRVRLVAPLRAHWRAVAGAVPGAAVVGGGLVRARLGAAAATIAVRGAAGVGVGVGVGARVVRARLAVPPHAHHLFEFLHTETERRRGQEKRSDHQPGNCSTHTQLSRNVRQTSGRREQMESSQVH